MSAHVQLLRSARRVVHGARSFNGHLPAPSSYFVNAAELSLHAPVPISDNGRPPHLSKLPRTEDVRRNGRQRARVLLVYGGVVCNAIAFSNAWIQTCDRQHRTVEVLGVKDGSIVAIGEARAVREALGAAIAGLYTPGPISAPLFAEKERKTCPADGIADIKVLSAWFAGEKVYEH